LALISILYETSDSDRECEKDLRQHFPRTEQREAEQKIEHRFDGETDMNPECEEGSENVFRDLGFSEAEADHLMIRSRLMIEVEKFVERSKLSQRAAAKMLGVTPPRLNDLRQGKVQKFSIDALVKMLSNVGIRVDVHVSAS
jgi:predicted XRE-type DNA-binding protein